MLRILLVEDEGLPRWTMRRALEKSGHAVEEAETCQAATDLLLQQPFDVVVLDYRLPDGTGLDVARELRRRGGRESLIFLTAESERITDDDIKALAVVRVLCKPVKGEELCELISRQGEAAAKASDVEIGRFRLFVLGPDVDGVAVPRTRDDWVALDLIETIPSAAGLQRIQELAAAAAAAGARLCLIGAAPGLVATLKEAGAEGWSVDFVHDRREAESLSRRLCANAERRSVLGAAVRRATT